jgi:VWFA-related protein
MRIKNNKAGIMTKKTSITLLCISAFFFLSLLTVSAQQEPPDHDPLQYDVRVRAVVVPLFAVDKGGNPVYDLKPEDLRLTVNRIPHKISQFKRFTFDTQTVEKIPDTTTRPQSEERSLENSQRVVFIVIDSVFNSLTGFRRAKDIALGLTAKGFDNDRFIIMESTMEGGIQHVAGPEPQSASLRKKISRLKLRNSTWLKNLFTSRTLPHNLFYDQNDPRDQKYFGSQYKRHIMMQKQLEKESYRHMIKRFSKDFRRLKYALQTVQQPKMVFFISEGFGRGAFKMDAAAMQRAMDREEQELEKLKSRNVEGAGISASLQKGRSVLMETQRENLKNDGIYATHLFNYVKEISAAVNKGGSVMYTINPRKMDDTEEEMVSGEMSMRYMAREAGGKYFAGSDTNRMMERISNITTAYYELAFSPNTPADHELDISIQSNRKDVTVYTLNRVERVIPYHNMQELQKKLFALNIVTGGSWSRMDGKVVKTVFKKNGSSLQIPIPQRMKGRKLDVYTIEMADNSDETDIQLKHELAGDFLSLTLKPKKNSAAFFVIIDPKTRVCLYNHL